MLANTKLRQKIKGKDYMPQMKTTACPVTIVEVPAVPPWGWLGLEKSTALSPRQDWTPQKPCKPCHQHTRGSKTHPGTVPPCDGGSSRKPVLRQSEVQEVYLWKIKRERKQGFTGYTSQATRPLEHLQKDSRGSRFGNQEQGRMQT